MTMTNIGSGTTTSLCMIVKNEAACLGRCLKSVADQVDEIIIVDTGSTDSTVAIAEDFGARIFHHPWKNDFSKHRNQSLGYAKGKWILIMDADEELFGEDGPRLREITQDGKADYYHCQLHDMKKDGSIHGTFYQVRLFRNGIGMDYGRKVHNQLRTQGLEAYSKIRIRHYGYDLTTEQMEAKHVRTTTLLQETLANDPEDVYSIYQLSSSYSMHREYDKAVAYGERALDFMRRKDLKNSYFSTVFHTVAQGYYAQGRVVEAERTCLAALDFFPTYLDMYHLLADIYFRRHSLDQYRMISEQYLHIHEEIEKDPSIIGGFFCHSFDKRHEIYFGLGCICFLEKDFDTADDFFQKSFADSGRHMEKAETVSRFYFDQRMDRKALHWLAMAYEAGIRDGNAPVILQNRSNLYLDICKIFLQQGNLKASVDCLQKADDAALSVDEQLEKRVLMINCSWEIQAMDELRQPLESLMRMLSIDTQRTIRSGDDLAQIVYDVAEAFCLRRQWPLAEAALQLALQIAPALFDHRKFERILPGDAPASNIPA
jgi:glycosyltransferase involved in cell wall biosynthesis